MACIFFRNAINVGLPVIICPEAGRILNNGDIAELDLGTGTLRNQCRAARCTAPLPSFLMDVLGSGGLVPYMRDGWTRVRGELSISQQQRITLTSR